MLIPGLNINQTLLRSMIIFAVGDILQNFQVVIYLYNHVEVKLENIIEIVDSFSD